MNRRPARIRPTRLLIDGNLRAATANQTYPAFDAKDRLAAEIARASAKDVDSAVGSAHRAHSDWSLASAQERGRMLYGVAEAMESRRDEFITEIVASEGVSKRKASVTVDAAIDRWVWYSGWADKFMHVASRSNPVAGPFFNVSIPEPIGVVGIIAPQRPALSGLVEALAAVVVSGNTAVVVASHDLPLTAVVLAEAIADSDVVSGVINVLTGDRDELAEALGRHRDIDGLDLSGLAGSDTTRLELFAADRDKRIFEAPPVDANMDVHSDGPERILSFCGFKTVWHPQGI